MTRPCYQTRPFRGGAGIPSWRTCRGGKRSSTDLYFGSRMALPLLPIKAACCSTFANARWVYLKLIGPRVFRDIRFSRFSRCSRLLISSPELNPVIETSFDLHFRLFFGPGTALCKRVKRYTCSTQISRILWLRRPVRLQISDGFDSMIPN